MTNHKSLDGGNMEHFWCQGVGDVGSKLKRQRARRCKARLEVLGEATSHGVFYSY